LCELIVKIYHFIYYIIIIHELCNSYIIFLAYNFVFNYMREILLILFPHYSMLCEMYTDYSFTYFSFVLKFFQLDSTA